MSNAFGYRKPKDLPARIPVFPLDGALILPRAILPLNIFEPRYLNMVDDMLAGHRLLGMVQTRPGGDDGHPALQGVGCVGRLSGFQETPDGRYLINLTGICRFEIVDEIDNGGPYRECTVDYDRFAGDLAPETLADGFDRGALLQRLRHYLEEQNMVAEWDSVDAAPPETLINSLCMVCPFDPIEKQALLEAQTVEERHDALLSLLEMGSGSAS